MTKSPMEGKEIKTEKEKENPASSQRFSPEEEQELLSESNTIKSEANKLFGSAHYDEAIQGYDRALSSCPTYLEYETAVLRSNIAACQLKMDECKAAVESATKALQALDRLDPPAKASKTDSDAGNGSVGGGSDGNLLGNQTASASADAVVEEVDDETARKIEALQESGHTRDEVQKLRIKVLMRRAKAQMGVGGWSALQSAEEDYKTLSSMPNLAASDRRVVDRALRELPPQLEIAKQHEMSEMMGKLKNLGNGLLKPFGLSTDNFNFIKDEKTGGYNMQFNQGGTKS